MDIQTIKKRRDFLKGNDAPYAAMPSVVVQSYMRTDEVVETDESVMMGITLFEKSWECCQTKQSKTTIKRGRKDCT